MAWFSVLPAQLTFVETWIIRFFLFLGVINLAPWILAIIFDFVLYLYRLTRHLMPVYGGRARGERRPRAPSVNSARRRAATIVDMVSGSGDHGENGGNGQEDQLRRRRGAGPSDNNGGVDKQMDGQDSGTG